jgi:hypothetical protein
VHNITDTNKSDKMGETDRTMSRTTQKHTHTAMKYALMAQEVNTDLLRRTSQAWIEGFRYRARLSQGMARMFFGQWGAAFKSMPPVDLPGQRQSGPEVIEPATNGAQKAIEPAAKDVQEDIEKAETAAFPIDGYDEMNVGEIAEQLDSLSEAELRRTRNYEQGNKNRQTLIAEMDRRLEASS